MGRTEAKNRRKVPWGFLASLLLFAAGAGIFLYPAASNLLAESRQKGVIRSYEALVEEKDPESLREAWEEAEIYNENLAGDPVHDPFILGSGYVLPENYNQVLNPGGDGVMGYLEIPKLSLYLPVYHGTGQEVLERGVGHLEATALPIGGENRHPVLSAHRGLPSAELFTRLDEMEKGDFFYIHVLGEVLAYEVDQIEVILPEELELLRPEEERDLVTLLTCTPYAVNTHRLLVRGTRIPYEEPEKEEERPAAAPYKDTGWRAEYALATGLAILAALTLFFAGLLFSRRKRRRRGKGRNRRKGKV